MGWLYGLTTHRSQPQSKTDPSTHPYQPKPNQSPTNLIAVDAAAVGAEGGLVAAAVHGAILPPLEELLGPVLGGGWMVCIDRGAVNDPYVLTFCQINKYPYVPDPHIKTYHRIRFAFGARSWM